MKLPKDVLRRGVRWGLIIYDRGSGQFPGGNAHFTGIQPPGLLVPCEDGTCQRVTIGVPMLPDSVCYECALNPCTCGAATR